MKNKFLLFILFAVLLIGSVSASLQEELSFYDYVGKLNHRTANIDFRPLGAGCVGNNDVVITDGDCGNKLAMKIDVNFDTGFYNIDEAKSSYSYEELIYGNKTLYGGFVFDYSFYTWYSKVNPFNFYNDWIFTEDYSDNYLSGDFLQYGSRESNTLLADYIIAELWSSDRICTSEVRSVLGNDLALSWYFERPEEIPVSTYSACERYSDGDINDNQLFNSINREVMFYEKQFVYNYYPFNVLGVGVRCEYDDGRDDVVDYITAENSIIKDHHPYHYGINEVCDLLDDDTLTYDCPYDKHETKTDNYALSDALDGGSIQELRTGFKDLADNGIAYVYCDDISHIIEASAFAVVEMNPLYRHLSTIDSTAKLYDLINEIYGFNTKRGYYQVKHIGYDWNILEMSIDFTSFNNADVPTDDDIDNNVSADVGNDDLNDTDGDVPDSIFDGSGDGTGTDTGGGGNSNPNPVNDDKIDDLIDGAIDTALGGAKGGIFSAMMTMVSLLFIILLVVYTLFAMMIITIAFWGLGIGLIKKFVDSFKSFVKVIK